MKTPAAYSLFFFLLLSACAESLPLSLPGSGSVPDIRLGRGFPYNDLFISGDTYYCGTIQSGQSFGIPLIISNSGTANLLLQTLQVSGAAFSLDGDPALFAGTIIPPGDDVKFWFIFYDAGSPGTRTGAIRLYSNDPDLPEFLLNLTGDVSAP